MVPPWQWHHPRTARRNRQPVHSATLHAGRCAAPPDTPHGTTPTYRATNASLCIPSVVTSTALIE
eukprot:6203633-Prymnesium_polylepis.1